MIGLEAKFTFISKSEAQIKDLKSFIDELFARNFKIEAKNHTVSAEDFSHKLVGYTYNILCYNEYFILVGMYNNCDIYDLVHWCTKNNRQHLLKDIMYLEEMSECKALLYFKYSNNDKDLQVDTADYLDSESSIEELCAGFRQFMSIPDKFAELLYYYFYDAHTFRMYYQKYIYLNRRYIFILKDEQQAKDLQNFINEVYARDWKKDNCSDKDLQHKMICNIKPLMLHINDCYVLIGAFQSNSILDLTYWMTKENKTALLVNTYFIINTRDDDVIQFNEFEITVKNNINVISLGAFYKDDYKLADIYKYNINISYETAMAVYKYFNDLCNFEAQYLRRD